MKMQRLRRFSCIFRGSLALALDCRVVASLLLAMTAGALREFVLQLSNSMTQDACHRPVFMSATGQAVISVPCSTKERAERLGRKTAFAAAR
jgi:hypothetical protein